MIVALGVAISFRSGILNIGGEGQIVIGAVMGIAVALNFPNCRNPFYCRWCLWSVSWAARSGAESPDLCAPILRSMKSSAP
jgi:ABC-type uncharacterized transport system permease subunit